MRLRFVQLFFCLSLLPLWAQITETPTNGRTVLTAKHNTLTCTFDNVGGAVTTIHISCKVPLGYILVTTTTPRPQTSAKGGSVGEFMDELGNQVQWVFKQAVRGVVTYDISTGTGEAQKSGTMVPVPQVLIDETRDTFAMIQTKCARCHGNDIVAGKVDLVGNLDLRTTESMLAGGDRGPAIVPYFANISILFTFAHRPQFPTMTDAERDAQTTSNEETDGMPPFFPLSAENVEKIRRFVDLGGVVR